jgi:drug/metabolite transporter (DMT)-like permease
MLAVSLFYGLNYFIVKEVFREISPFGVLSIRSISGTLVFFLIARFLIHEKIRDRSDYLRLIVCAIFGISINQFFFLWGLSKTYEVNAAVLMITSPVFVFLIAWVIKAETLSWRKIGGLLLSFGGATLLVLGGRSLSFSPETLTGDLMIMLNALSYGTYLVLVRPLVVKYHPLTIIMWIFFFGAFINIPIGISDLASLEWGGLSQNTWLGVLYVIIFPTILAYSLNAWALTRVPSSYVGIYVYLQPVLVTGLSVVFARNTITVEKLSYILLVLLGVFFVTYTKGERKKPGLQGGKEK